MSLRTYTEKRDFKKTAEPRAKVVRKKKDTPLMFVVQEHHASHLHYDFRLEWEGVLKSWAVPKGPSLDPGTKRLAVEVEDHPLDYGSFEGVIPEKEYGGGEVYIWDTGIWNPLKDPKEGLRHGHLEFELKGKRLKGRWDLIRTKTPSRTPQWLLIKKTDKYTVAGHTAEEIGTGHEFKKVPKKKSMQRVKLKKSSQRTALKFIEPMLAQLVDGPPEGGTWLHETKFDGYRIQAHINVGDVRIYTRSGQDWTDRFPTLAAGFEKLNVKDAILDGEAVVLDEKGRSDFQKLQNALKAQDQRSMFFYGFDILHFDGKSLQDTPLIERKKILEKIMTKAPKVLRYSDHIEGQGHELFKQSCKLALEGIVSKRADSTYTSGRRGGWLKSKCGHRQEFVIAGFTDAGGARSDFGALLLGVYEGKDLRYVGRVGTGFTEASLKTLGKVLRDLETEKTAFTVKTPKGRDLHWVKPKKMAEVSFSNWTNEKILRTPVFHGLREDKNPLEIIVEKEVHVPAAKNKTNRTGKVLASSKRKTEQKSKPLIKAKTNSGKKSESVLLGKNQTLSNPQRVVYPDDGMTKLDIAKYYMGVSKSMLAQLEGRPLSLVRFPEGAAKGKFFQKHIHGSVPEHVEEIDIQEKNELQKYMIVNSTEGLLDLVQMGAFELHNWNCHQEDIEHPDQFIIDLDPGPGVTWNQIKESALEVKEILEHFKLKSFLKTSGGKGLHVHVPIAKLYSWDQIRNFTKALAQLMEDQYPNKYVSTMSKKIRKNKIFVDYLRNGRGSTAVTPYSLRAADQSAAAMPLSWSELKTLKAANQFTIDKALVYLKKRKVDPWKGYNALQQKLPKTS
jgi:bifunctional non-homologous end joining protein LigD